MATIATLTTSRAGAKINQVAANGGGDAFVNTGVELLVIKNADSGAHTVTIVSQSTVDGLAVSDRDVVIPAGEEWVIGPFPTNVYNDTNNRVQLSYSAVTSVTVAVVATGT